MNTGQHRGYGSAASFRSQSVGTLLSDDTPCPASNMVGHLHDFQATAAVAYLGVDHNAFEPLGFHQPDSVRLDWGTNCSSYSISFMAHEKQAPPAVNEADPLVAHRIAPADGEVDKSVCHPEAVLAPSRELFERHLHACAALREAVQ